MSIQITNRQWVFVVSFAVIILTTLTACNKSSVQQTSGSAVCEDSSTEPECATNKINTRGWEDSLYVTPDGTELYFTYTPWNFFPFFEGKLPKRIGPDRPGQLPADNPWENPTTYVSRRGADGRWGPPVAAAFNITGGVCCAMVTDDRKEVYYQRKVSGTDDIVYSVVQDDGTWSEPIVFGPEINSSSDEGNPQLSGDGRTLFWSSTRPDGLGGHDIWFSQKSDAGEWSQAQNMGEGVNSDGDEDQPWVNAAGDFMLFTGAAVNIFESKKVNGQWETATPVHFETTVEAGEPTMTAKGDEMYMVVVDRDVRDLIVSVSHKLPDGTWSMPTPVPE